jgi:hypothetical protein
MWEKIRMKNNEAVFICMNRVLNPSEISREIRIVDENAEERSDV